MRSPFLDHPRRLHEAIAAWLQSRREDEAPALHAAKVGKDWLRERPEHAGDIHRLVTLASYLAIQREQWEATRHLAALGLDAALLRPLLTVEDLATTALSSLFAARAAKELGDALNARLSLLRADETLREVPVSEPIAAFLRFQQHELAGELAESSLENTIASEEFSRAVELGEAFQSNRRLRRELEAAWGRLLFGEIAIEQAKETHKMLGKGIDTVFGCAVLGRGRTSGASEDARAAVEYCRSSGLPNGRLLALHRIIENLELDELDAAVESLTSVARNLDENSGRNWMIALTASQASARARHGQFDAASRALLRTAIPTPTQADAIAFSLWFGTHVRVNYGLGQPVAALKSLESFLSLFHSAALKLVSDPVYLPFRVACEPAFALAIRDAFAQYKKAPNGPGSGRQLALLLDALRAPVEPITSDPAGNGAANRAAMLASDRLGRLDYALQTRPGAVALIVQNIGPDTLFVCLGGSRFARPLLECCDSVVRESWDRLALAAQNALQADYSKEINFVQIGRDAFDSIPAGIRKRLSVAQTILLVPDFSASQDRMPFELLHDGHQFLGLSKAVTRCLSLSHAVSIVEPPLMDMPLRRRFFCVAVPEPPGLPALTFAESEAEAASEAMRGQLWDVQRLVPSAASPAVVIEAAPLAGVIHIASHGDVSPGAEGLVLADGTRLSANEVAASPRGVRAVVYLNACSLGRGRYLGGGVSRGMAYAFARSGAPAVVANLLPVEDRSAAQIAEGFYDAARDMSIGQALCRARATVVAPAFWSASVLIGDPWLRLGVGSHVKPDAASRLLAGVDTPSAERLSKARNELNRHPRDVRLAAAIAWAEGRGESKVKSKGNHGFRILARAAQELGHAIGEAECSLLHAEMAAGSGDSNDRGDALRQAIAVLARLMATWKPAYDKHRQAIADLQALDPTFERRTLTTYRLESGFSVNDRSEPAVAAFLDIDEAMDEHDSRWRGEPELRVPDKTIADAAWNAIVWGYQYRLFDTGAESGYAAQFSARLVWRGLVPAAAEINLRRILSGILSFLWGKQKVTHLNQWFASAQAEVVRLAIENAVRMWTPPELSPAAQYAGKAAAMLEEAMAVNGEASPYARARAALAGAKPPAARISEITSAFESLIEGCSRVRYERADLAAWLIGLVYEKATTQYSPMSVGSSGGEAYSGASPGHILVLALETLGDTLSRRAEVWFEPYLYEGFREVRETGGRDLLDKWRAEEL
jgi:hypothetical protein